MRVTFLRLCITFSQLVNLTYTIVSKRNLTERPYTFVFGWSSGHVGTTTLSSSITYSNPENINFIFETKRHPSFLRNLKRSWKLFTHQDEKKFVEKVFMPLMLDHLGNATTLVDLGHHNLYFIYGLLEYLNENKHKFRVLFVRICRERYETALSLTYSTAHRKHDSICRGMLYRYCPIDRYDDVILKPINLTKWMLQLNEYQKALWMIDEIDARWQYFLTKYKFIEFIEVYWSKSLTQNSLENAAYTILQKFNVTNGHISDHSNKETSAKKIKLNLPHLKVHSDINKDIYTKEIQKYIEQDQLYQNIMKQT